MFKVQHTEEEFAILQYNWLEIFIDELRKKRKIILDFNESDRNLLIKYYKIYDQPFNQEEKDKLYKFERKMFVATSFGMFLENKDIYDCL